MVSASATTVLLLKDGGTLEGELLNPDEINRKLYRVKSAEGLEISLDAKLVERTQSREREALLEYNRDAPLTHNSVENHLYWARWCQERQLAEQARMHWQQTLELDPDHADARTVLGYTKTVNGWESQHDRRINRGLVQDRGRLKTPYQIEVETILGSQKREADDWQRTIRELYRFPNRHGELLAIRDPAAYIPIREILVQENNPQMRMMLLRLLMQIPDDRALQFVIGWTIRPDEPSEEIRKMCIEELQRRMNERPEIRQHMIAVYRSSLRASTNPAIIELAAKVLGDIGGHEAVPELIDVLVTTRRETIQPQTPTYGFGSGGSGFSQPGKPVTRQIPIPNQTVLSALRRLTGANFEFDQAAWREWHRQSLRSPSLNLRRD
jgi:hypothetical protein